MVIIDHQTQPHEIKHNTQTGSGRIERIVKSNGWLIREGCCGVHAETGNAPNIHSKNLMRKFQEQVREGEKDEETKKNIENLIDFGSSSQNGSNDRPGPWNDKLVLIEMLIWKCPERIFSREWWIEG